MNLPNKLTVLRMVMVPFFVFFLLTPAVPLHYLWAGLLFGVAAYTDHLDGSIARKRNLITTFGKFMDPLADKVLVISALVCFVKLDLCNIWFVLLIVAREFMVTSVRLVAVDSGKVIAANNWGKLKTVSQILAIVFILVVQLLGETGVVAGDLLSGLTTAGNVLVGVSCLIALYSGWVYLRENWGIVGQTK